MLIYSLSHPRLSPQGGPDADPADGYDLQVTAVSWSSTYPDLFVAAYGSFDFQKQSVGLVAGFSLKNAMWPEFHVRMPSGLLAQFPNLVTNFQN